MRFEHIHFGAGRRSLGAIVPLSINAGGRVQIVVHGASELPAEPELLCSVRGSDGRREELPLRIGSLSFADAIEQLDAQARAVLFDAPELLLTTAITAAGIDAQSGFLVELARARAGKYTVFIPCEEDLGDQRAPLTVQLRTLGVDVRRSVVNRLCSQNGSTVNGRRAVRVDEHAEWLIEGRPDSPLLRLLAEAPSITFTSHIEEHALRTRWLARGIQLQLVLLAAESGQQQVRLEAIELERERWLERVCSAFVPLVEQRCKRLSDTATYARKQTETFLRHDDDVLLALHKLKRANLLPFLDEVRGSISEPCRELVQATNAPLPADLRRVFYALDLALSEIERYSDYLAHVTGEMQLTEDDDAVALDAYRNLLTDILAPEEVAIRVYTIDQAFNRHRLDL